MAEPTAAGPRTAYLDCTAGVAGDMLLGALIDAGASVAAVRDAVAALGVPGLGIRVTRARRGGFSCARVSVGVPGVPDRVRHLPDVLGQVARAPLGSRAAAFASRVFTLIADAEGEVHGTGPQAVHFHEVGAFDSLADVVGCASALDDLGLLAADSTVSCSPLAAGSGFVDCAHGRMPVPVPAVVAIAAAYGLGLTGGEAVGERTTPTGAALVAALAAPGPVPDMTVRAVGVGGGGRDTPDRPNITRVVLGDAAAGASQPRRGDAIQMDSTVDDLDPRLWPSVLSALRAAGAWDCWTTEVIGRHGRPGRLVTALCPPQAHSAVAQALFTHTTTLGVRWSTVERLTLPRHSRMVPVGSPGRTVLVAVKAAGGPDGALTVQAELADAERAAQALGWPLRAVCEAAVHHYRQTWPVPSAAPGVTGSVEPEAEVPTARGEERSVTPVRDR
ncbi:nickel pincer cofactor biosynthesis protein LarC [Streptomyces sp. NPDC007325]|uniref:nickel pincer cofactor biosynthesis protein LarC n=1 Tax=Streptomyces sp. NPDC007325 TaxID=3154588 RepID=UPI0033CBC7E6